MCVHACVRACERLRVRACACEGARHPARVEHHSQGNLFMQPWEAKSEDICTLHNTGGAHYFGFAIEAGATWADVLND